MNTEVDIKQLAITRDVAAPRPTRRRRHFATRYAIPAALLAGFASLVAWASRDALLPPHDVWVIPVLASQSAVQSEGAPLFQAAGWVEPRPTPIRVAALAPGVVERLLVVQDQPVKAGEPVAELVKADAQLAFDRSKATLLLREAEVDEANAALAAAVVRLEQPVHLEVPLADSESDLAAITTEQRNLPFELRRAEAQLTFAETNFERKKLAQGAVSGLALAEAQRELDAAKATVEELRTRSDSLAKQAEVHHHACEALRTQLKLLTDEKRAKAEAEARLQAAKARLEEARIAVAEAQLRLDRMTIRSPIDGRVYQLVAYPGTTLTGGMGPVPNADGSTVITVYQPAMLQIRVDARFEDIPKVSLGQQVTINNPALDEPIAGKVLFVSSEANIQKNTLQVKVAIDSPQTVLKPEMLVDVTFLAPKAEANAADVSEEMRLYLPQQVIQRAEGGVFVWLADQSDQIARRTPVELGRAASGGLVEVRGAGISVASRIITRGFENLDDGQRIRIVSEEPASTATAPAAMDHRPMSRLPTEGE